MKHIGYTNSKTWGSDFPSGPVKLFIPDPGTRENVSADHYEHIGWINPDNGRHPRGGKIHETHEQAGPDSRPAYVFRDAVVAPASEQTDKVVAKITMGKEYGTIHHPLPPNDKHGIPTIALLSEALDFCAEELDGYADLDGDSEINCTRSAVYIRELVRRFPADPAPTAQPVTREEFEALTMRVDTIAHMLKPPAPPAEPVPTSPLIAKALALCNDRLDQHRGSISCENAYADCNAANTMIRELVRRLSECHAALQPFAQAGAGGRGSALKDDAPLAIISADMPDLPQWIAKANCVVTMGDVRRVMDVLNGEKL